MNRENSFSKGKETNPVQNASFFSKRSFWWLRDTFGYGQRKEITEEKLYATLPEHSSHGLAETFERLWSDEEQRGPDKASFARVYWRAFGKETLFWGLLFSAFETANRVAQPLLLGELVSYFTPNQDTISKQDAYLYAAGIITCSLLSVISFHPFIFYIFQLGMKFRIGASCLIYNKVLKLSKSTTAGDGLNGKIINLLSNDVGKFDIALCFVHDLWKGPMEAILLGYFIYRQIGFSGLLGMAFLLSFIPLQAWVGKKTATYRLKAAKRTDLRVRFMNEIIQGIQVIKMYTWESSFAKMIGTIRRKEIQAIRGGAYVRATLISFFTVSRVSIFISLLSYTVTENVITAKKVFIVTSFYSILNDSMVHFWPMAITFCAEGYISLKRIRDFLLTPEGKISTGTGSKNSVGVEKKQKKRKATAPVGAQISDALDHGKEEKQKSNQQNGGKNVISDEDVDYEPLLPTRLVRKVDGDRKGIVLDNATARWVCPSAKEDTKARTPASGAGDGSEEATNVGIESISLRIDPGRLCVLVGPVGSGKTTLLQVLLGELELDDGNVEIYGTVSYAAQEPWLFEGSVRNNILFTEEYNERRYLRVVRVCALEKDFEMFPHGDQTIVGERGISLSGGQKARVNLARAIYRKADIYLLDDPLSAVDTHVGKHIYELCIREFLANRVCVLVTHQLQYLKDVQQIVLMNAGRLEASGSYRELKKSNMESIMALTPDESPLESPIEKELKTLRQRRTSGSSTGSQQLRDGDLMMDLLQQEKQEEEKESQGGSGSVGLAVYKTYITAVNSCGWIFWLNALMILSQIVVSGVDIFVAEWVNWEERVAGIPPEFELNDNHTILSSRDVRVLLREQTDVSNFIERQQYIWIYSGLIILLVLLVVKRSFSFFYVCLRISINLHDRLFRRLTRATMHFFNTNPSGRILNRFSKDIGAIDSALPMALLDCVVFFLEMIAVVAVVSIVNYWFLVPTAIVAILMYYIRQVYLNTSRVVKRIESVNRSPLFSHTNATLQGLSTIRAFGAQSVLRHEFNEFLDVNSSAWYMFISTNRAFALWLDLVCVLYIAIVTISFLLSDSQQMLGGSVGLAITKTISLVGMCQWGMRQSAELENQMVSVERVNEYTNLPSEPPLETAPKHRPQRNWPEHGAIRFVNVDLRYSEDGERVLKDLNFVIRSNEKVGIVGRTGAGKSSLIQALFRLAPFDGNIEIDDIDTKTLGLRDLRSKISIIPQDPILFSGTLRSNLDPFDQRKDDELWSALDQVELKEAVSSLAGGLECRMSDGGNNFSMGQRQLVCLARAILRNNKILVLDEATANVDPETDKLIQTTIRTKFAHCTVLTIAHRLHTVMDSDRVLVMDAGRVVEFGHPHELLHGPIGYLRGLVDQTGVATAAMLMRTAEENFKKSSARPNEALRITKAAGTDGMTGQVINLMSNDVAKFDTATGFVHDIWKGLIELLVLGYFIYKQIGISGLFGIAFLLSFIPLQAWLGKKAALYRLKTANRTDRRIQFMNEIIQGIQVIKIYAWEESFSRMVDRIRRKEVNGIRGTLFIRAGLLSFNLVSRVAIFLSLVAYVLHGNVFTAKKVFIVTSYFNWLYSSMLHFWPLALTSVHEGLVSIRRIQDFLLLDERKFRPHRPAALLSRGPEKNAPETVTDDSARGLLVANGAAGSTKEAKGALAEGNAGSIGRKMPKSKRFINRKAIARQGIFMRNGTAFWDKGLSTSSNDADTRASGIKNVTLTVDKTKPCVIVGPVGSGKSTMLQVILGELELDEGQLEINGNLSYASQEPWLFEGTVKNNIVFTEDYQEKRYREVVSVCALERDFRLLPHGDQTIVGERGISLSGGQRARISLARAVYRRADIYLLDDPLSAVDTHVGKHIFEECIIKYLKDIEHVVLMNTGSVEAQGPFRTLAESGRFAMLSQHHQYDDPGQGLETRNASSSDDPSASSPSEGQHPDGAVAFCGTTDKDNGHLQKVDSVENNGIDYGSIINIDLTGKAEAHGMTPTRTRRLSIHPTPAQNQSAHQQHQSLYQPSPFSSSSMVFDGYDDREERRSGKKKPTSFQVGSSNKNEPNTLNKESQQTGRIGWRVYKRFFQAVGSNFLLALAVVLFLMAQVSMSGIDYYISQWVNWEEYSSALERLKSNRSSAGVSTEAGHLNGTDYGAILPIPTKLQGSIFSQLSRHQYILVYAVAMLFMFVLSLSRSFLFFYICLRATVRLHDRLFRGITRATMYFFNTNPSGRILNRFSRDIGCIDTFLPFAMMDCILWLEMVCVLYIAVVTLSFLMVEDSMSGNVGLAITQVFNLIFMCQWGMRQTAELENQMTSVERVVEYAEVDPEPSLVSIGKHKPPADWPAKGAIRFEHFSLRYSPQASLVLRDLNLSINAGAKIGIVGRTGAGKSSIIQALFRLAVNEGIIHIDGVDIGTLGLHDLRKRISIIPQDPILFSGTVRENLDPFKQHDDDALWNALDYVELKRSVMAMEGTLDGKMSDGGSNFSMGQRQLVCLARAILRNNRILILDEATANVDTEYVLETDKLIQRTIRERFESCTVLTIAHRLHTVMDSDRVLVMDAGKAIEYGHPHELLQRTGGALSQLVSQTEPSVAEQLATIALKSYNSAVKAKDSATSEQLIARDSDRPRDSLEIKPGKPDGTRESARLHPFATASSVSRYFFWWLFDVLRIGVRRQIVPGDIYDTLPAHRSARIGAVFEQQWQCEISRKPTTHPGGSIDGQGSGSGGKLSQENNRSAPWRLLRTILRIYGAGVLVFGFVYSAIESACRIGQPFLLGQLILYFDQQNSSDFADDAAITLGAAYGYAVGIVMTVLGPMAIFHWYQLYLLQVGMKIRIGCCSLIYRKVLELSSDTEGLSGTVINLMANDVSRFDYAVIFFHDLWKGPVELIIVAVLVYLEIGPTGLIGIGFLLLFIPIQAWLGKKSAAFRMAAALATDERVRVTNEIVRGIQVIKMYVWERPFEEIVSKLRRKEIQALRGSAIVKSALFALRVVPKVSIFLSLVAYVYLENAVTARRVYMLISFFSVIHHSMVEFWPLAVTSAAEGWISLKRIQAFLLQKSVSKQSESQRLFESSQTDDPSIEFQAVCTTWEEAKFELKDLSFKVSTSIHRTVAIVGPVGAGKSTVLNLIIGEQPATQGKIQLNGIISYCPQKPWMFEGTIRQNITFLESYDEKRYQAVLKVCALEEDVRMWPSGDNTMVGERGYTLSGGQKARINLARALYRHADIYLLDDPLSAVDAQVANVIFEQAIRNFLVGKLGILVTHHIKYASHAEHILVMNSGKIIAQGNYEQLSDFFEERHPARATVSIQPTENRKESLSEAAYIEKEQALSERGKLKEEQEDGTVQFRVYVDFLKSVRSASFVTFVALLMIAFQVASSGTDYFLFIWVDWEETYANTDQARWSTDDHVLFYTGAIIITILLTSNSFAFFEMCLKASLYVHSALYRGVSETAMYFFQQHASGRIMNRFSKDIGLIDSSLPVVMIDSIYFFLELGGIVVIVSLANYWLLIPTAIMGLVFYVLRFVFLRTARNVKRVEAITRSPVFTHTNATIDGLPTIRAFGAERFVQDTFHGYQDINTSAMFLFGATTRGFAFWLDMICLLYIASVVLSFLVIGNDILSGNVGLAITQVLNLIGMCNWGIRQTAELENQMTSVERVLEYARLEPEKDTVSDASTTIARSEAWPENPSITFREVYLRYAPGSEPVLKRLCFEIKPKERVGIVGRTGAGKSSIIQALFRLTPLDNRGGIIEIDGINIGSVPLRQCRSRISIIPQDPVIFSGSLRNNLDPFERLPDEQLWKALEQVGLKATVAAFAGGLNTKMAEGGTNFSAGQRQLLCLARAILKASKILILDEATANIDTKTDTLIQHTIKTHFNDCTILTIAHRLHTILDNDRVMVMDAGRVVEFDSPDRLLQIPAGYFRKLVAEDEQDGQTGQFSNKQHASQIKPSVNIGSM
ncbi:uncharacterized protein LOC128724542 [Anopheles nili]|uniref:uncharacterized protein LOC128724542 n=1 Tax=Anopheles nili TaxID=185578 RepID=UPI00237B7BBF|nr:uncharacterized protein LOC128724542 [Anopheles nili]